MESYTAYVELDDFIFYADWEKVIVLLITFISYIGGAIGLVAFMFLFKGNQLIKLWNFYVYL